MNTENNNTNTFKPKLRVTTLDDTGAVLTDRLVEATAEFYNGPKIQHKGPVRIEVTLTNTGDINSFKEYLDRLVGNLPVKQPSQGRGRPSSNSTPTLSESPREDILLNVENMIKEGKTQDEVIKYLRELGFVFILTEDFLHYFEGFPFDTKDIGSPTDNNQYLDSMSWMVRCIKRAKDPQSDKFDPMIIFGFNILREKSKKIVPYLYKERKKPLRASLGKAKLSFSAVEFTKFPKYQLEEERLKWSAEMRALLANHEKKPSKFFIRWAPDILLPDTTYEKLKHLNIKFQNDLRSSSTK